MSYTLTTPTPRLVSPLLQGNPQLRFGFIVHIPSLPPNPVCVSLSVCVRVPFNNTVRYEN